MDRPRFYVVVRDANHPHMIYEVAGYASLEAANRAAALIPLLPDAGVVIEVRPT